MVEEAADDFSEALDNGEAEDSGSRTSDQTAGTGDGTLELSQTFGRVDTMRMEESVTTYHDEVAGEKSLEDRAALVIQKEFRRRSSMDAHKAHVDQPDAKILQRRQSILRAAADHDQDQQRHSNLTVELGTIYQLDLNSLLELRALCHKPCFGPGARLPDENYRLYEILSHLPAFHEAFQPLPQNARLRVVRALAPRILQSRDLLLRNSDSEFVDAACVVLQGEATIYIVSAGEGRQAFRRLGEGVQVSPDMIDEECINAACRSNYELQASCKRTIEVLRLPQMLLDEAMLLEEKLDGNRSIVREILSQRPPWSREREELFTICGHLIENCESFNGVPEEDIAKVIQQAELMQIAQGYQLCRRGDAPDGLRVLLSGSVSVHDSCGEYVKSIGVDESVGEWQLCYSHDDCYDTDVFADGDCDVVFISRALYMRYLRPARCYKVLQDAAVASLMSSSAAELQTMENSGQQLLRPRGFSQFSCESNALALTSSSVFSGLGGYDVEVISATTSTLPESVVGIDCMLGYHNDSNLAVIRSFSQDLRHQIWAQAKFWRASRGEVIFNEGDANDAIFVVIRGQMGLFQQVHNETDEDAQHQREELAKQLKEKASAAAEARAIRRGTKRMDESYLLQTLHGDVGKQELAEGVEAASCETVMTSVVECLFDSAARRSQNLQSARVSVLPDAEEKRMFIHDSRAEELLLGKELPADHTDAHGDIFFDMADIGVCTEVVDAGCASELVKLDLEYSTELLHSGVALSATFDLLVIGKAAMSEVLSRVNEGNPSGQLASDILQMRQGHERTPQDLLVLDALIKRHRAFKNLECRARSEICRKMTLKAFDPGELLWAQGDPASSAVPCGFFQILHGLVNVHIRARSNQRRLIRSSREDASDVDEENGDFALCLGEGAAFGEEAFLRGQELQPLTLCATEDVEVAWIQPEAYRAVMQDWLGEASGRRKALDALRRPTEGWGQKDVDSVANVLQNVQQLKDMDADARIELTRLGSLVVVPAGEYIPFDDVLHPLYIVLCGCVGRYPAKDDDDDVHKESPRIVFSSCSGSTIKSALTRVSKKSIAPVNSNDDDDDQESDDANAFRIHREIQLLRDLSEELSIDMREPLKWSLRERLNFHAVNAKLKDLQKKLDEVAPDFNAVLAKRATIKVSACPTPSVTGKSATVTTSGLHGDSPDHQASSSNLLHHGSHTSLLQQGSHTSLGLHSGSNGEYDLVDSGPDSPVPTFELTQMDADGDSNGENIPAILDVSQCEVELREGETLGGWDDTPEGTSYRAHYDTELLLVSKSAYDKALELAKQTRIKENASFLRSHLPSKFPLEVIEKIAPCFSNERKLKGNVLVREGSQTNTIWMVVNGACECKVAGRQPTNIGSAVSNNAPTNIVPSTEVRGEDTKYRHTKSGTARFDETLKSNHQGIVLPLAKSGKLDDTSKLNHHVSAPSPPAQTGDALVSRSGVHSHMPKTLGTLEEGKFIGLLSALFPSECEPNTVEVSSSHVQLLAISKHDFTSRVHGRVVDILKELVCHQRDWYASQSARLADLPRQISLKLNEVRYEVHEANLPRLIDSPFLRRQGEPGMEMLDHICERFGSSVHPESEWLFASRDPSFFQHVRLANLEGGHPEAAYYTASIDNEQSTEYEGSREHCNHGPANWRFQRFTHLSHSLQGESVDSALASQLSPRAVSQVAAVVSAQGNVITNDYDWTSSKQSISTPTDSLDLTHSTHIPLMKPARVFNLPPKRAEVKNLAKTVKTIAPEPKSARSPGRKVPEKAHTFKSKAKRDLQALANCKLGGREDTFTTCPPKPNVPRHLTPATPPAIGARNQRLPPISALTEWSESNNGYYFFDGQEPNRFLQRTVESANPNMKSLRRGTDNLERAAAQLALAAADTSLRIGQPGNRGTVDGGEIRRSSSGYAGEGRPSVWRRGRLSSLLGTVDDNDEDFY